STHSRARYRRSLVLVIVTYVAGLLALALTLAAFVALRGIQTIAEIIRAPTQPAVNWTQFGFDATVPRPNPAESRIKVANVALLHVIWRCSASSRCRTARSCV